MQHGDTKMLNSIVKKTNKITNTTLLLAVGLFGLAASLYLQHSNQEYVQSQLDANLQHRLTINAQLEKLTTDVDKKMNY